LNARRLLAGRLGGVAGCLALGQLLVGATYVLPARGMVPESLGILSTCFAIGTIAAAVFDFGLTGNLVREIASGGLAMVRARSLVSAKRRIAPALVIATQALCLLIMPETLEGLILGIVGWAVWEAQTANALLRALGLFSKAASAQLAGRLLGLLTSIAMLLTGKPELALASGLATSFGAEALIAGRLLGPNRAPAAKQRDMVSIQRASISYGFAALAGIGQQLDTPLVTVGGGAAAGGVYAAAGRLLGPLLFLSSSLALVAAPWLAGAQRDRVALRTEERRIGAAALIICLGPLLAAALGPVVIPWILGHQYAGSGRVFVVLAIGAAFSTINQAMATILQNRGAEALVARAIGIGLALGLTATYLLAALGGPVWAALGFTISQLYIVAHLATAVRGKQTPRWRHRGARVGDSMTITDAAKSAFRGVGLDVRRYRPAGSRRNALMTASGVRSVVDVGANTGQYGKEIRQAGFSGTILSFEPLSGAFDELLRTSSTDNNWLCKQLALSDHAGSSQIYVAANSASSSLLVMASAHCDAAPGAQVVGVEEVVLSRLDAVEELRDLPKPLMLKLDVQGLENQVLHGADGVLDQVILIEAELSVCELYQGGPLMLEMFNSIDQLGFELVALEPGFHDPRNGRILQFDGLFQRRERPSL
jgi:FkbM family methyltransferase